MGVKVMTPYGEMGRDGSITLSPAGTQKYQQAKVQLASKLGPHPFAGDPRAPQIPTRLGRWNINAFTGRWVRG